MGGLRRWRRGLMVALAGVLLAACGGTASGQSAGGATTLNWYIFHDVSGSFPADAAACSAASDGEYNIQIRELPVAADGQREQLVRRSAAKDSSLDILGLDVVWEAEFAEAGWIQPWTGARRRQVTQDAVKAALDTATWKRQLVAAPFNSNTQLLWYRKDLVPHPPRTWAEMIGQAETLARQGKPHDIEIQGASYEGYTVWVNAMVLSAGGRAFEINYPFVYPSAQQNAPAIARQMGWAEYPRVDARLPSRPRRRHRPGRQRLQHPQAAGLRRHRVPARPRQPAPQRRQGRAATHPGQPVPGPAADQGQLPVRRADPRLAAARRRPPQDPRLPVGLGRRLHHPVPAFLGRPRRASPAPQPAAGRHRVQGADPMTAQSGATGVAQAPPQAQPRHRRATSLSEGPAPSGGSAGCYARPPSS
jgi:hypothetical protein